MLFVYIIVLPVCGTIILRLFLVAPISKGLILDTEICIKGRKLCLKTFP